ncbi:MAG: hypothetical protein RIG82_09160 [Phycisphaeraceae bacterium]
MSPAERWTLALHECGHGWGAACVLRRPSVARLYQDGQGRAEIVGATPSECWSIGYALMLAAGKAAESLAKDHAPPEVAAVASLPRAKSEPVLRIEGPAEPGPPRRFEGSDWESLTWWAVMGAASCPEAWAPRLREAERLAGEFVADESERILELARLVFEVGSVEITPPTEITRAESGWRSAIVQEIEDDPLIAEYERLMMEAEHLNVRGKF